MNKRVNKRININGRKLVGGIMLLLLVTLAIVSIFYTPYDPEKMNVSEKFLAPSFNHLMGTDNFGRDIFSRVMKALFETIKISTTVIVIGFFSGLIIGTFTGYFGGILDEILMRINDALSSIPSILLAIVTIGAFGSSTTTLVMSLGIVFVPSFARMIRGKVIEEKNKEYVLGAKIMGASSMRIIFKHILPNTRSTIMSTLVVGFNNAILAEASLSFLGIGLQPPKASLGAMLKDAQTFLAKCPWYSVYTGLVIVILIVSLVLLSDGSKNRKRVL